MRSFVRSAVRSVLCVSAAVIGAGLGFTGVAKASDPASDNASASVYTVFSNPDGLTGLNGGNGFGPWQTSKTLIAGSPFPNWAGFAGWFQAYGNGTPAPNPDLNDVKSGTGGQAFGSYANSNNPGQGLATTTAVRSFTNGPLSVGQTFTAEFEHGNVSFYPSVFDLRLFGWVGVIVHATPSYGADPFFNGIAFGGVVGVGFRGGATTYEIVTLGGSIDTGIPFQTRGLRVAFTRVSPTVVDVRITRLSDNQSFNFPGAVSGFNIDNLNGFGLVNRNAQEANVYFNNFSVTGQANTLGACCTGSVCVIRDQAACAGESTRFAGIGTACNASGNVATPCCIADFNQDGTIDVPDIFAFLSAWFTMDVKADVDRTDGVQVADIFAYLSAFFARC